MGNVLTQTQQAPQTQQTQQTALQVYDTLLEAGVTLDLDATTGRLQASGALDDTTRALIRAHAAALHDLLAVARGLETRAALLRSAHARGYVPAALAVPEEAVALVIAAVCADGGDAQKTMRLLSRDRSGDDVATACLLANQRLECARYRELGGDPFAYDAAQDILIAENRRGQT